MNKQIISIVENAEDINSKEFFELSIGVNDEIMNIEEMSYEFTASNQARVFFSILAELGQKKKQKLKMKYLIKDEIYADLPSFEQTWVIAPNRYIGLIKSTTKASSKKGKGKNEEKKDEQDAANEG